MLKKRLIPREDRAELYMKRAEEIAAHLDDLPSKSPGRYLYRLKLGYNVAMSAGHVFNKNFIKRLIGNDYKPVK